MKRLYVARQEEFYSTRIYAASENPVEAVKEIREAPEEWIGFSHIPNIPHAFLEANDCAVYLIRYSNANEKWELGDRIDKPDWKQELNAECEKVKEAIDKGMVLLADAGDATIKLIDKAQRYLGGEEKS